MTTNVTEIKGQWNDRGTHIDAYGKDIRLQNGATVVNRSPYIMDHFYELVLDQTNGRWIAHGTGTTGDDAPFAILATEPGGAIKGRTGTDTNAAQSLFANGVTWKPTTHAISKPMFIEARFKVVADTTAADGDFYFGWGDAVSYTNDLPYVLSAASAVTTSVPSDAAVFAYTSLATSGTLFAASGNNYIGAINSLATVDTVTALASNSGPVQKDSNYHIYRVAVDAAGNAAFYIDDVFRGSVALAVTPGTALTPLINVVMKSAHQNVMTIDYIAVGADCGY